MFRLKLRTHNTQIIQILVFFMLNINYLNIVNIIMVLHLNYFLFLLWSN